jgi:hypothetical protein
MAELISKIHAADTGHTKVPKATLTYSSPAAGSCLDTTPGNVVISAFTAAGTCNVCSSSHIKYKGRKSSSTNSAAAALATRTTGT